MAVVSKEALMERLKAHVGEDTSDEVLALIEDINDTYDYMKGISAEGDSWKAKYEENDASWRKRYKARFLAGTNDEPGEVIDDFSREEVLTYDELFKE